MRNHLITVLLLLLFLSAPLCLYADGFALKDGRYAGGPVVQIKLTKIQNNLVSNNFKSGRVIKLTKLQQTKIKTEAKLNVAPTKLEIYHAEDLANDCTCFVANIGFDFKPGWIEAPMEYLCSDKEAEARQPDPNE